MAQYKKEEIQTLILNSAEELFASKGYKSTTISDIAKASGISVGNVYRYYKGKDQILDQILPKEFVESLQEKLRSKILTGKSDSISKQSQNKEYLQQTDLFQNMLKDNQQKLVILMQYSQETPYESFRKDMVQNLSELVLENFCPAEKRTEDMKDMLEILYDGYIQMTLQIATKDWSPEKKVTELKNLNYYHIMGLGAILGIGK